MAGPGTIWPIDTLAAPPTVDLTDVLAVLHADTTYKIMLQDVVLKAWPVGSVFVSVSPTSPATLLGGGTWVAFGTGRTLVGVDTGQTEFNVVEEIGGVKTHTLTSSEMPSHTHVQDPHNHTQNSFAPRIINSGTAGTVGVQGASAASNANASNAATTATNQTATATNQVTGGGAAHNNLQPYITVFFWKRTA